MAALEDRSGMSSCLGENKLLACAHITTAVNVVTWDRQWEFCHFLLGTRCRWSDCEIDSREQSVYLQRFHKVHHTRKQYCKVLWSKRVFMKKWNTIFKNILLVSKNHLCCVLRNIRRKCNSCLETGGWHYETFQRPGKWNWPHGGNRL